MEKSQWYIGARNGVVVCVDRIIDSEIAGRFYHSYSADATYFSNVAQLLFGLEDFFNELKFPHPATNERVFHEVKRNMGSGEKKEKKMKDEELLKKHGNLGSFIIRVQHRQNSSWQGRITWMDQNKTVYFRSMWEMVKLMANALDTVSTEDGDGSVQSWFDEEEQR